MSEQWFYAKDGQQQGPVDTITLKTYLVSGRITQNDLVWKEGMAGWVAAGTLPELTQPAGGGAAFGAPQAGVGGYAAPAPPPAAGGYGAPAGGGYGAPAPGGYGAPAGGYGAPAGGGYGAPQAQQPAGYQIPREYGGSFAPVFSSGGSISIASVGRRFVASFIDGLLIVCPIVMIGVGIGVASGAAGGGAGGGGALSDTIGPMLQALIFVVQGIYYGFMESSESQATIGKRIMKLKVADLDGNRLSVSKAMIRGFARTATGTFCGLLFLFAFFNDKKQCIHDKFAGSIVIDA